MKYLVTAPLTVGPGIELGLTDEQAKRRAHALRKLGKGRYQVTGATQFKRGEFIRCDMPLPKELLGTLEQAEKPAPRVAVSEPAAGLVG